MTDGWLRVELVVRCRVGSSENMGAVSQKAVDVRCRVGSSEKSDVIVIAARNVRCRVGSSEIARGVTTRC